MSFEWALKPISSENPTGPNLDTSDDPDFVDYYFDALGRLPDRYVVPGMETEGGRRTEDRVFDPKSIDIKEENKRIRALLEKSLDIRLLTLMAQFECLAGRIKPLAEATQTIADLIDLFGDQVHPAISGSPSDRKDALNELAQPITMVTALKYMGMAGGTEVTLRKMQVAEGKYSAHSHETNLSAQAMRDTLGSPSNRQRVDETHASVGRMIEALKRIESACKANEASPFSPGFEAVLNVLGEMRTAITEARPDLRGADADIPSSQPASQPTGNDSAASENTPSAPSPVSEPSVAVTAIKSHAEARLALLSCETYFQSYEPSSAALLLVRQARQLIGKPLVVALETLLPEECGKAMVAFGPQTGFVIPAQRLKTLSDDNLPIPSLDALAGEGEGGGPTVANSADLAIVIRSVEEFFNYREKSSPVPILLQRARSYLDKDFQSLVDELIPRSQ